MLPGDYMKRFSDLLRMNPPLVLTVVANLGLFCVLLPLAFLDTRLVTGQPVWIKPLKFAISVSLYSGTLMWLLGYVKKQVLARRVAWIVAVTLLIEMILIVLQAARGVASHFNVDAPVDGAIFSIMGLSIAILWIAHLVTSVSLLRDRTWTGPLSSAVRGGMIVAALGMVVAFVMTAPGFNGPVQFSPNGQPYPTGHIIGAPQDAPGLAILGWSTTGGDLRVSHFVGLHALQILPLFALLLSAFKISAESRILLVRALSVVYGAVVVILLLQALRGIPFFRMDSLTLGSYAVCAIFFAGVVLFVLFRGQSRGMDSKLIQE